MGHLVNPIGFRLGFLDSWLWRDFWCVKHLYYSEFLYNTYSMRELLHSLLNDEKFEGVGGLYSHFCIYKKDNKFYIYVFLYDARIEESIDSHLVDFMLEESEHRRFGFVPAKHAMVRKAMSRFFNIFVGNMCYFKSSSLTWSFSEDSIWVYSVDENRVRQTPPVETSWTSKEFSQREKWLMRGVNHFMLKSFSERFKGIRLILLDSLLPIWKSIFLFKVIFGSGFMSGLRMHALNGMQEPFYTYMSFCFSDGFLDSFSLLKTSLLFLGISNSDVTSFMLASYMGIKLANYYTLWELITPLRQELTYLSKLGRGGILGFKFHFCGRFSRKQSASSIWVVSGALPLNTTHVYIDYAFSEVVLKNSICSIKVWLYSREGFRRFSYSMSL